eukprot:237260-Hanusia_phi.AAC.1
MGMAAGMAGAIAPDLAKGKPALIAIFKLIDQVGGQGRGRDLIVHGSQKPKIDADDPSGLKPSSVAGEIELREVSFTYPARPDVRIFERLNLSESLLLTDRPPPDPAHHQPSPPGRQQRLSGDQEAAKAPSSPSSSDSTTLTAGR